MSRYYNPDPTKWERPEYEYLTADLDICISIKLCKEVPVDKEDVEDGYFSEDEDTEKEDFIRELKELLLRYYPDAKVEDVDSYCHIHY